MGSGQTVDREQTDLMSADCLRSARCLAKLASPISVLPRGTSWYTAPNALSFAPPENLPSTLELHDIITVSGVPICKQSSRSWQLRTDLPSLGVISPELGTSNRNGASSAMVGSTKWGGLLCGRSAQGSQAPLDADSRPPCSLRHVSAMHNVDA